MENAGSNSRAYISSVSGNQNINMRWSSIYNGAIDNGGSTYDNYTLTETNVAYDTVVYNRSNETPIMNVREWIDKANKIFREWSITALLSEQGVHCTIIATLMYST